MTKETTKQRQARLEEIYNKNDTLTAGTLGGFSAVEEGEGWFVCRQDSHTKSTYSRWKLTESQINNIFDSNGIKRYEILSKIIESKQDPI